MAKSLAALWIAVVLALSSCSSIRIFHPGQASFEQGLALFNQGNFKDAIPHFQQATADNPEFAEAYLYLGRSYLSMRRWREAIPPLRTADRLSPEATRQEAFTLLLDALFAAALDAPEPGRPASSDLFKDRL